MVGIVKDMHKVRETYCTKCEKITISKRLGRAHYHCEECDNDKSLSDVFWYEATQKTSNQNRRLKEGCSVECSAERNVNTETDIEPSSRPPFPTKDKLDVEDSNHVT